MRYSKKKIFKIVILFLISILLLSLHLIGIKWKYQSSTYWFGIKVSLNFMYDLVLYSILGLIILEVILIGIGD